MKEVIEKFVLAVISFMIVLIFFAICFYFLKIIWLNIFSIWGIFLTPNQSSAVSFLTMIIINCFGKRGAKNE